MSDKPILFSGPMVRALLAGTKTQTRRVAGVPIIEADQYGVYAVHGRGGGVVGVPDDKVGITAADYLPIQPGDRLWVKENFAIVPRTAYRNSDGVQQTLRPDDDHDAAVYAADWERSKPGRWRPSIHMFRWASRLTLHVTGVRVERLQDISNEDAIAEGCKLIREACYVFDGTDYDGAGLCHSSPITAYGILWDAINGPGAWDANPWVAAYTFEVERANIANARAA